MKSTVAVTGGCGFIGAAFIRKLVDNQRRVINLDLLTYAGDEQRLNGLPPRAVTTERLDISSDDIASVLKVDRPDTVFHFAAQTHVTRSETDPEAFFRVNVEGTHRVLEAAEESGVERLVHISTDEVYGPCNDQPFKEDEKLPGEGRATSVYARSKARADDLARAFQGNMSVIVVRPTNSYGPWQYPEKAIARWTSRALDGRSVPVWGGGSQMRDWMFVDDACDAIYLAGTRGRGGDVFNIGPGNTGPPNIDVARTISRAAGRTDDAVYLTEYDRPDHDERYAVDTTRIRALGWTPKVPIERGIAVTVDWYRSNASWWRSLLDESESIYDDEARASES